MSKLEQLPRYIQRAAELAAEGYTDAGIARQMGVSRNAAGKYLQRAYAALNLKAGGDWSPRVLLIREVLDISVEDVAYVKELVQWARKNKQTSIRIPLHYAERLVGLMQEEK